MGYDGKIGFIWLKYENFKLDKTESFLKICEVQVNLICYYKKKVLLEKGMVLFRGHKGRFFEFFE